MDCLACLTPNVRSTTRPPVTGERGDTMPFLIAETSIPLAAPILLAALWHQRCPLLALSRRFNALTDVRFWEETGH